MREAAEKVLEKGIEFVEKIAQYLSENRSA